MTRRAALAGCAATTLVLGAFWLQRPRTPEPEPEGGGLRLLRGGAEVELSGPLSRDLAEHLRAVLATPAPPHVVQLNSIGGSVTGAEQIAALIRAAKADTVVTDLCQSACVAAFMGGTARWVGPFAIIGLEAGARQELPKLYAAAGVPEAFVREAGATPAEQAWFPTTADMLRTGMATGQAGPEQFALGGFGPAPTAASIRARLLAVPLYRALAAADPAGFDADLAVWTETVMQGEPGTAAFERTRDRLSQTFQRMLPQASDALLLQHAALFTEELGWMERNAPADCPIWAAAQGGRPGPTDAELVQRRRDLMLSVLTSAPSVPLAAPPAADVGELDCDALLLRWSSASDIRPLLHAPAD